MLNYKLVIITKQSFPYGMAEIQKLILIAKTLLINGAKVEFLITSNSYSKDLYPEIEAKGKYLNMRYKYLTNTSYRNENFLVRNLLKSLIIPRMIFELIGADIILLNTRNFTSLITYSILSHLFSYKILLTYVELDSARKRRTVFQKINDYVFEKYAFRFVDLGLPITSYLKNVIKKSNPLLPTIVLPTLVNLNDFDVNFNYIEKSFLFCGSAAYFGIISLLIDSFIISETTDYNLKLIINGTENQLQKVKNKIDSSIKKDKIIVISNVDFNLLVKYYKTSFCLLIPLNNDLRDISRFPHKIGEYTASKRPIITNAVGDVNLYFKDKESAVFSKGYSKFDYSNAMEWLIKNESNANKIGENGYKICQKHFDYKIYSDLISNSIIKLF